MDYNFIGTATVKIDIIDTFRHNFFTISYERITDVNM